MNIMIIDMSLQSLKLLVLSSFMKSDYASSMDGALQSIEGMVFNPTAAQKIYFAIFDSLVDSGELFRKKLVSCCMFYMSSRGGFPDEASLL